MNYTSLLSPVQVATILRVDVTASLGPASGTSKLNIASLHCLDEEQVKRPVLGL